MKLVKILSSKENIYLNWGKYWGTPSDGELGNSKENKNCSCLQIADMSRIPGSLTQTWLIVLTDKSSPEHTFYQIWNGVKMVKNPLIHEVFAKKTSAFNPGHRCQIVVSESKIFPEKFTSHNNLNVAWKILNVIHVYVYSPQTLLPICQLRWLLVRKSKSANCPISELNSDRMKKWKWWTYITSIIVQKYCKFIIDGL